MVVLSFADERILQTTSRFMFQESFVIKLEQCRAHSRCIIVKIMSGDNYCKVLSSILSRLVAHSNIFRLFIKGKFDAYVL